MGDCLNTALDNIFISCPIIELINEVCTPAGKSAAGDQGGDSRRVRIRVRREARVSISVLISIPIYARDFLTKLRSNLIAARQKCRNQRTLRDFVACPPRDV